MQFCSAAWQGPILARGAGRGALTGVRTFLWAHSLTSPPLPPRAPETWATGGEGQAVLWLFEARTQGSQLCPPCSVSAVRGRGSVEDVTTTHSEGVGVWQDLPSAMQTDVPPPFCRDVTQIGISYTVSTYNWPEGSGSLLFQHHTTTPSRRGCRDPSSQDTF